MKDAKTLLLEFLAAVTGGQNAAALFAENGAVELPFLHSVGIPWRHQGRQAISEVQASLAGLYLDFALKPEDTHVLIDTPEQVFAEYMAHPTAAAARRRERRGPSIGAEWTGRSSAARDHRVHLWTPFGIKSAAISSPVPRIEAAINDGLSAITMCLKNRFQCVTLLTLLDCLLMSLFPRGHRPISGGAFSSRGGGHVGNRSTR
jgi:hypothetical protein